MTDNPAIWPRVVDTYIHHENPDDAVRSVLVDFRDGPRQVNKPIDPGIAAQYKPEFVEFVLDVVRTTLQDHELSPDELDAIRHICWVLHIHKGELLEHRREFVTRILTRELELLLADDRIDPHEAMHKVKVQEALGVSYDQFIDLRRDKVDEALVRLLERFDESTPQ